jgi:type IV pilus assembly protein PilM
MVRLFYKDKPITGLDISSTGVKIMSVDPKQSTVVGYGTMDLDPIKIKDSLEKGDPYLADNLKVLIKEKMVGELTSRRVVVGIPTARSYSRTFILPVSAEKNLNDAIILEADQYIPIASDMLYIDSQIIERTKKEITVLMSAVAKTIIDNISAAVRAANLEVAMIEPSISAVGRVLKSTEEGSLPTVIVDIGPESTDIAILDGGVVRVTSGVTVGGNTFTLDIAKKMGVALENAHQLKVLNGLNAGPRQQKITAALTPSLDRIIAETRKVIRYYQERIATTRKLEQLLVVGSGSNVPGIGDYFTNALLMPARVASPWQKLDFGKLPEPPKQFRPRYISVAGLASVKPEAIWK